MFQDLKSIHSRHHDVQQNYVREFLDYQIQRLTPIFSAEGFVIKILQFLFDIIDVEGFIVNDQDPCTFLHLFSSKEVV